MNAATKGLPGLRGTDHIGFTVPDLQQAIDFFVDVIGCEPFYELGPFAADDDWMAEHLAEEFSLGRLAEQAGMSEFHFNRLFKRATGVPPSQYQIKLRMDASRRLLRETKKSVIAIANEVGYSNPSHFAQLFRKEEHPGHCQYQ